MNTHNITKSGTIRKRYSNELPTSNYSVGSYQSYGGNAGLSGGNSSSASTGSGTFDWNKIDYNAALNTMAAMVSSIWGNDSTWRANYLEKLNQETRTTVTILWVVIGLLLALGVVLLIRKTK